MFIFPLSFCWLLSVQNEDCRQRCRLTFDEEKSGGTRFQFSDETEIVMSSSQFALSMDQTSRSCFSSSSSISPCPVLPNSVFRNDNHMTVRNYFTPAPLLSASPALKQFLTGKTSLPPHFSSSIWFRIFSKRKKEIGRRLWESLMSIQIRNETTKNSLSRIFKLCNRINCWDKRERHQRQLLITTIIQEKREWKKFKKSRLFFHLN